MTGNGCDIGGYTSGALVCSSPTNTETVKVVDSGKISEPSVSDATYHYVGATAGEFRVNESGAATYSVPFALPSGTAGVQPSLGLSYSSAGGESIVGQGWNITGLSAITRCPKNFAQDGKIDGISYTKSDRLCLDGQRLVTDGNLSDKNSSDTYYWSASRTYHTEIDSFSKIKAHFYNGQAVAFTVETKSGEIHYYGYADKVSGTSELGSALKTTFKNDTGSNNTSDDAFVRRASNSAYGRTWALKAIKDVKNNYILFNYTKPVEGEHLIDSVLYTGNASTGLAPYTKVKFNYQSNYNKRAGWLAGYQIKSTKLLSSISVSADGDAIRHYKLGFDKAGAVGEKNMLTSITECLSSTSTCLKPLTFKWKKNTNNNRMGSSLFTGTTTKKTHTPNYDTAKVVDFNGDGFADIIYVDGSSWKVKFGPSFGTVKTLYTGKTNKPEYAKIFDFDGDGVQDLLVANSSSDKWTIISNERQFTANYNNCGYYGYPNCSGQIQTNYKITSATATDISNATIIDVDGDTLGDILFASGSSLKYYRNKGDGSFESAQTALTFASSSLDEMFQISDKTALKDSAILDVNGDGRTDLIFRVTTDNSYCANSRGVKVPMNKYECNYEPGYTWHSLTPTYDWKLYASDNATGFTFLRDVSHSQRFDFRPVDMNGDGLSDIIFRTPSGYSYRLSNGKQLGEPVSLKYASGYQPDIYQSEHEDYAVFLDVSGDGRTDMLLPDNDKSHWRVYVTVPDATDINKLVVQYKGQYDFDENRTFQFADANGDGKVDIFQSNGDWFVKHGGLVDQPENVIIEFASSFGVKTNINYSYLSDDNVYYSKTSNNWVKTDSSGNKYLDDNYFSPRSGIAVVSTASTQVSASPIKSSSIKYEYGGLLVHKNGRGMLGFEKVRTRDLQTCTKNVVPIYVEIDDGREERVGQQYVTDVQSCVTTETTYNQLFPYTGMPKTTTKQLGTPGPLMTYAKNTVGLKTTAKGGYFPYIKESSEESWVLDSALSDSNKLSSTKTVFGYDTYGNVLTTSVTQTSGSDSGNNHSTTTNNSYGTSTLWKRFGRLSSSTVTKVSKISNSPVEHKPGDSTVTRSSSFDYYSDTLLLKTETINKGTNWQLVTTHKYDAFGNRNESSTVGAVGKDGASSQTRINKTNYDSTRGNYVVSQENSLGHKTYTTRVGTKGTNKGRLKTVTTSGLNGASQTQHFDNLGQIKLVESKGSSAIDPTIKSRVYKAYCSSVECYSTTFKAPYYRVIEVSPGKPEKQTFFDKWGREVGSRIQAFNGTWTVTKKEYDSQGRAYKVYEPGENAPSSYVTTFTYDRIGRVVKEVNPRGTVNKSYNYNVTTTENELGQQKLNYTNYLGTIYKVEDKTSSGTLLNRLHYRHTTNGDLLWVNVYKGGTFSHTQVRNEYNDYGHKVKMTDLDKGNWEYSYNAFGELVWQKNSSGQITSFSYDKLGRKASRYDADGYTRWTYDGTNGKGKLKEVAYYKGKSSASGTPTYRETSSYRSLGLLSGSTVTVDGETFRTEYAYDHLNRLQYTLYPDQKFQVEQTYTSLGFPSTVKNATNGHREYGKVYQRISDINLRGQVTEIKYGNGTTDSKQYQMDTGWLEYLGVHKGTSLRHKLDYTYDSLGNLKTRTNDFAMGSSQYDFTETFGYDSRNRLDWRDRKVGSNTIRENYSYDALGNITYKQGTGYYKYDSTIKNRLKEVWSGSGFTGTKKYGLSYDNRGNVTNDGSRSFKYTAFDKPYEVNKGSTKTLFSYGPSRELYKQVHTIGGKTTETLYLKGLYERKKLPTGVTEHKYYVGNAVVTDRSNGNNETSYLHKDNLGSTITITNASGNVVQHFTYDPWGKQNAFYGSSHFANYSTPAESKGYTGHKMMNDIGIIHMNGRIYDPTLGRFLQADPHIQAPMNSQSYNRYSYVLNNPLSYTDPSGYFFKKLFKAIGGNKFLSTIISIGLNFIPGCQAWCSAAFNAAITYAVTGSLKGALIGAFVGAISPGGFDPGAFLARAAIGGLASRLQGGKFGHGFIAAGASGAAGGIGNIPLRVIASAVIGGTVSKITGGKFANGATSAAFATLVTAGAEKIAGLKDDTNSAVLTGDVGEGRELFDGKVVVHRSGNGTSVSDEDLNTVKTELDTIFTSGGEGGQDLQEALSVDKPLKIILNNQGANAAFLNGRVMAIDLATKFYFQDQISGNIVMASNTRIFVHEMGHALLGKHDIHPFIPYIQNPFDPSISYQNSPIVKFTDRVMRNIHGENATRRKYY
nr:FG-GAP-like repeat-containing protein [Alteromonas sp. ASW11-130]